MSNFQKRTKRAWEENEYDAAHQHKQLSTRKPYPQNEPEAFLRKEALFPREVLQPLYERWERECKEQPSGYSFFLFLLKQCKP